MATIVTRSGKGSPLTNTEVDANFTNLNSDKLETSAAYTNANAVAAVVASDLDMGGNKVLFGNVYSALSDLPNASTYHGMFAHVHATGLAYYAHGGAWVPLARSTDVYTHPTGNGNNHIPSGGASGQILGYSSAGTAQWQAAPAADPTRGTLTKSFTSGETASITLSAAVSPTPVVSATKEISQAGVSSKGAWDVASNGANYDRLNSAYNTTLTFVSQGWDVSTSIYSQAKDISGQDTNPFGMFFKPDGTKMYHLGNDGDDVNEYNLSTAWDISTAVYNQSVSSYQESTPRGLFFKPDGSKMYIVGTGYGRVYEYNLSTAWDISTASHNQGLNIYSQEGTPNGLFFKPDGTRMYIIGSSGDEVNEYSLSTAWDVTTASHNPTVKSVSSETSSPFGIFFRSDGTKMYVLDYSGVRVYEYNLSTAWDISTAVSSHYFSISQAGDPTGLFFKPDGMKMYVCGRTGDSVYEYNLSVSDQLFTLGTGSFASTDIGKTIEGNNGAAVLTAADGSYAVTTAFSDSSTIAAGSWSMNAVAINATNGLEMSNRIIGAFDIANIPTNIVPESTNLSSHLGGYISGENALIFKPDGLKLFFVTRSGGSSRIHSFTLTTAFDASTIQTGSAAYVAQSGTYAKGLSVKPDGTRFYWFSSQYQRFYQITLTTPWDLSTAGNEQDVGINDNFDYGLVVTSDGTKVYAADGNADIVSYDLGTAWDITTVTNKVINTTVLASTPDLNLALNADDTKLYFVDGARYIREYTFGTKGDISTLTLTQSSPRFYYELSNFQSQLYGLAFNSTGTRFAVMSNNSVIYTFDVGTNVSGTGYVPSVTNSGGQIDSAFWTDINSMTADEISGAGAVHYAVSTDNHTTWSVIKNGSGVRPIVRDNGGTWQYNTAAAFEGYGLSNASFNTNDVFDVSSQVGTSDTLLTGVAFNSSGTKMYVNNLNTDTIYQYSLSSAFTVNTASYDNVSLDVSGQVSHSPYGIVFSPDGTKMYHVGSGNDRISQYTLSTAFDLSTAQYASKSFDLDTITSNHNRSPIGLTFNGNGTKIYVVGSYRSNLSSISLSTAYDVSTASYDGQSADLAFSSQDSDPRTAKFNNDGTKLFMLGRAGRRVYLYNLSTAYNISTALYSNTNYVLTAEEFKPYDLAFSADGTKMFIAGSRHNKVYQYSTQSTNAAFTTSTTWANSTTNSELYALQQALTTLSINRMDKAQIEAVTDPNHFTLGNSLDLMISLYLASASSDAPSSDGVSINYDAASINQGAVLGTDYDYDFPNSTTVRVTSNAAQNLKVRVV